MLKFLLVLKERLVYPVVDDTESCKIKFSL
jgi:hypothetical protein